jgi:hypothetical protein
MLKCKTSRPIGGIIHKLEDELSTGLVDCPMACPPRTGPGSELVYVRLGLNREALSRWDIL